MIRRAAFYLNKNKEGVFDTAAECALLCREEGIVPLFLESDRAEWEKLGSCGMHFIQGPTAGNADAIFIFGGDGTVLRALDEYVAEDLPVLGINLGRLGFLPEVQTGEMKDALHELILGNYTVEHRMLLSYSVESGGKCWSGYATNEVTVSRGTSQRMIAMDVSVDDQLVGHYIADGVLVSSPTGSTGYSLSAGGPIISPDVSCMLINPVCAHIMEARPVIVSDRRTIEVGMNMKEKREGMLFSADGNAVCSLFNNDRIRVCRSQHDALMIHFPGKRNFYSLLKSKLSERSL